MRGEYILRLSGGLRPCGSSPHAWGILAGGMVPPAAGRFIPTCVGNTIAQAVQSGKLTVHPHMRGEYLAPRDDSAFKGGSSPHAWGILILAVNDAVEVRFIPTCVGNTACNRPARQRRPVHPHMRGEYYPAAIKRREGCGSSPHAWGIHSAVHIGGQAARFIPTCVGNTRCMAPVMRARPVHPHMRGEYGDWPARRGRAGRFIPTCVGNTPVSSFGCLPLAVHPHMRGEYAGEPVFCAPVVGSSPHAWGILF